MTGCKPFREQTASFPGLCFWTACLFLKSLLDALAAKEFDLSEKRLLATETTKNWKKTFVEGRFLFMKFVTGHDLFLLLF